MKHLLACLFIGCLVGPAWGAEPAMTLEEFVQKLEKAEPWTLKKVEALLEIKLKHGGRGYEAYGQFVYVKSLIFNEIELIVSSDPEDSGKTIALYTIHRT